MSHVLYLKKQAGGSVPRSSGVPVPGRAVADEGDIASGGIPRRRFAPTPGGTRITPKTGEGSLMAPFLQSGPKKLGPGEKTGPLSLEGSCS